MTTTYLHVQSLEEEVTYTFKVKAQTIDYGPPVASNVTTGPQEGSPSTPKELSLVKTLSSIELKWFNGATGKGPILGYYIASRRKGKIYCSILLSLLCFFTINFFLFSMTL